MPDGKTAATLLLVTTTVLLGGCGGNEERAIAVSELQSLVLQEADLGGDWLQFAFNPQTRADALPGERADPRRFGRRGGWIARYRRPPTAPLTGAAVIESRVDLFESNDGAEQDLEAARADLRSGPADAPEVGDGSAVGLTEQESTAGRMRFYTIVWRQASVTSSMVVQGSAAGLDLDAALTFAGLQERRIERALED